jgi:hypothetical protein
MRRVLAAVAALFALATSITPASADDEASVRDRLASVADQAAQNRQQMDRLQAQIADRQSHIAAERAQLKGLAKAIYVEPETPSS